MLKSRYRCYPILDENDRVVGTLSRYHLIRPKRKRVVLVDHNEAAQSVPGLDQAEILEIIDHHRLADIQTGAPIYFRNEPVGSTTTIIATMYQEKGLMPSEKLAGMMAAAIVSDTVMFKSPTCTQRDRSMAERMARIANVSLEELGQQIFSASWSDDKTPEELLFTDFKDFHIAGHDLGVGQITCVNSAHILERKQEFLDIMQQTMQERHYSLMLLMLTDVAGVLDTEGALIPSIRVEDVPGLFESGTVSGGMIPKLNCCVDALEQGVEKVVIVDGRVENCVLLELLTDQGVGTEIVGEER